MNLYSIRSGSRGNSILVYTEKTRILIDCGISGKTVEGGMKKIGIAPSELSAVLITHEHNDHISGVGVMTRRYNLPVFANEKTWVAMSSCIGKIKEENKRIFENKEKFRLGDIEVTPFKISHDAADPVGYSFEGEGKKISIATDIGMLEKSLFRAVKGSNAVLLESNHDRNMLEISNYPLPLKQRIRSDKGHLSNEEAGYAAKLLYKMGTKKIMLGHLSRENNYPLLARQTVENILSEAGIDSQKDIILSVAPGKEESQIIAV